MEKINYTIRPYVITFSRSISKFLPNSQEITCISISQRGLYDDNEYKLLFASELFDAKKINKDNLIRKLIQLCASNNLQYCHPMYHTYTTYVEPGNLSTTTLVIEINPLCIRVWTSNIIGTPKDILDEPLNNVEFCYEE